MPKVYLSGPMSGKPDSNHPLFNKVAALLRGKGYFVFNPAEYAEERGEAFDLRDAFVDYCTFICKEADILMILPGWEHSCGSLAEIQLARNFPIEVQEWERVEVFFQHQGAKSPA